MSLNHLLFPFDSAHARRAFPSAARVARAFSAQLSVLRVLDPFRDGGPTPPAQEAASLQPAKRGVEQYRIHIDTHSDAVASIVNFARKENVDAITFPSKRRGLLSLLRHPGSMLQRLLGESPCPLWLLGDETTEESPDLSVRRVLCAVSGRDRDVLASAAAISERFGAQLFLLNVVPETHEGLLAYGFDDHVALSVENGIEMLAEMQRQLGTDAQPIVEMGNVRETIARVARVMKADLVVTGRTRAWAQTRSVSGLRAGFASQVPPVSCETLVV